MILKFCRMLAAFFAFGTALSAQATIVEVTTNLGKFEINLYDDSTPVTVQNFLNYVSSGRYDGTVFHRSVPGFVLQGGGFRFEQQLPLVATATNPAIINEPKWSNVKATVAMAKLASDPNSATNQWFINLANNAANLNVQNGGFTVFGVVTGTGMSIVDSINDLYVPGGAGLFNETPLRNYSATDWANKVPVTAANIVTIERITIINDSPTTAANLNPAPNTLAGQGETEGASSGSSAPTLLMVLAGLAFWRRRKV